MDKDSADPNSSSGVLDILRPRAQAHSLPLSVELLDHVDQMKELDRKLDHLIDEIVDLNRSERIVLQAIRSGITNIDALSAHLGLVEDATRAICASLHEAGFVVDVDTELKITARGIALADQTLALRYRNMEEASTQLSQQQVEAVREALNHTRHVRNAPQLPQA